MNLPIFGAIDSFLVALAMALAGCPAIYRSRVILGFLAFDTLAGLAGSALGVAVSPAAYAVAVALAFPVFRFARRWPALYLTLPLLFSIDNFLIGNSDATTTPWAHFAGGIVSGALAFGGFTVGTSAVRLAARLRAAGLLQERDHF
jgi:hypothetical protein